MAIELNYYNMGKEEGAWVDVVHPLTGKVLEDETGKARMRVRSVESVAFRKVLAERVRRQQELERLQQEASAEEILAAPIQQAASLLIELDGLTFNGEEVGADAAKIKEALVQLPWLVEQVLKFGEQRSNFLPR